MAAPKRRDARGLRVPRAGTRSRAIYDLHVAGLSTLKIWYRVRGDIQSVRVLLWRIRNPDRANGHSEEYRKNVRTRDLTPRADDVR